MSSYQKRSRIATHSTGKVKLKKTANIHLSQGDIVSALVLVVVIRYSHHAKNNIQSKLFALLSFPILDTFRMICDLYTHVLERDMAKHLTMA